MGKREQGRNARCTFCGKGIDQVRKLVAGPGVYICDSCVTLCNEIIDEDARGGASKGQSCGTPPRGGEKSRFWERLLGWHWRNWRVVVANG